jgi:hypothetical protein
MRIRLSNVPSPSGDANAIRLLYVLVTVLGCQIWGCASAKIGDVGGQTDGGTGDAEAPDSATPNDKNAKNDAATADSASTGNCDPFSNSGCNSGMKCTALQQSDGTLALGCDAMGSKAEGDDCVQTTTGGSQTGDDCGNGLACFGVPTTCHRMCAASGTANGCPGSEICASTAPGLTTVAFCLAVTTCQPLEQTGCPSGQACYFSQTGALCAQEGSKSPGDTCTVLNDCAKGSTCLLSGVSTGACSSFCSTASDGTPSCSGSSTGGSTCASLGSSAEPDLGSCR